MRKRLVQITILLTLLGAALGASAYSDPAADCCSNACGNDKECYYWCKHDPGGPCPREIINVDNP